MAWLVAAVVFSFVGAVVGQLLGMWLYRMLVDMLRRARL